MTLNSYEELEAQLRKRGGIDEVHATSIANALADLRNQRDAAQKAELAISDRCDRLEDDVADYEAEIEALRAENERLTRERDEAPAKAQAMVVALTEGKLNHYEVEVLEMLAGKREGTWGAWVSACLEFLSSNGYCTRGPNYQITDKGRAAIL